MANKMNEEVKKAWNEYKDNQLTRLVHEATEQGLQHAAVKAMLEKGISRKLDELHNTVELKEQAVSEVPTLELNDLVGNGRASNKQALIARVHELTGMDQDVLATMNGKALQELISAWETK